MTMGKRAATSGKGGALKLLRYFGFGFAFGFIFASIKLRLISRDVGGLFTDPWTGALFLGTIGGLCTSAYAALSKLRENGGITRWLAYAGIGVLVSTLGCAVLFSDGGQQAGLAGAPVGDWIAFYCGAAIVGAALGVFVRKCLDLQGVLPD